MSDLIAGGSMSDEIRKASDALALAAGKMAWRRTDNGYVVGFEQFEPVLAAWADYRRATGELA